MKVTPDSNILARANLRSQGPARKLILRLASQPGSLILSQYILEEVGRILFYPRLVKRFQLSPSEIAGHVQSLAAVSVLVEPAPVPEDLLRDPKDAAILGTAIAGNAGVLCTMDRHLFDDRVLALARDHGIRIMNDVELLALLDSNKR
ncbi:MAG TPA: putative toxin-antitoxin system toxin component, PIN family [Bryobacteraceae bacterium]|nr:putative toxin-antitoxin system toxin component, PIN family [Bryobacteraceae bacterium]